MDRQKLINAEVNRFNTIIENDFNGSFDILLTIFLATVDEDLRNDVRNAINEKFCND